MYKGKLRLTKPGFKNITLNFLYIEKERKRMKVEDMKKEALSVMSIRMIQQDKDFGNWHMELVEFKKVKFDAVINMN